MLKDYEVLGAYGSYYMQFFLPTRHFRRLQSEQGGRGIAGEAPPSYKQSPVAACPAAAAIIIIIIIVHFTHAA